jgi:hypothetical protein
MMAGNIETDENGHDSQRQSKIAEDNRRLPKTKKKKLGKAKSILVRMATKI